MKPSAATPRSRQSAAPFQRPQDAFVDERRLEAQWRDLRFTARPDIRRAGRGARAFARAPRRGRGSDSSFCRATTRPAWIRSTSATPSSCRPGRDPVQHGEGATAHEPRPPPLFETAESQSRVASSTKGRLEGHVVFLEARTALSVRDTDECRGSASSGDPAGGVDDMIRCPCRHWSGPDGVLHLILS